MPPGDEGTLPSPHARTLRLHGLKLLLKRSTLLRAINARVKALWLVLLRARLLARYARRARATGVRYEASRVPALVAERLARRGINAAALPERLGVLWVGADLDQDLAGFLPALERHADVTRFHRAGGGYGVQLQSADGRSRAYDPAVVAANDARLLQIVEQQRRAGVPLHMVFGQMWAHTVSVQALQHIQQLGIVTVNVSMDDRLPQLWHRWRGHRLGSVGIADGLDLVLTTSSECCLWYNVEGCPALWWPLASDPTIFVPAVEEEKVYDISFIGSRYGVRDEIVDALTRAGVNVAAFGPGWPNGPVNVDAVARIFGQSRLILGIGTIAHNTNVYTLKLRDFDATMAGALYITHRNPDLLQLFEEQTEIVCYETKGELVAKVRHYLANPDERRRIGARARMRAEREHTWDLRIKQLFTTLRNAPAAPGH